MGLRGVGGGTLLAWGAGWGLGIAWQLQRSELGPAWTGPALVGTALLLALVGWRLVPVAWSRAGSLLFGLALALLAAGQTEWRAHARLSQELPRALEGADLELVGVIDDLPQRLPGGWRFVFAVESARQGGAVVTVPPRVQLSWYGDEAFAPGLARAREPSPAGRPGAAGAPPPDDAAGGTSVVPVLPELRAAERWRLPVRLRQPHGTRNPHGFDAELRWFEQGVRATGSVRTRAAFPPLKLGPASGHAVDRLRQRLREAIDRRVPDARQAGVLAALAIGDQSAISREDWALFRDTGVAHLMSISGLHVTMFSWGAAGLLGALWRRHRLAPLWLPAPTAARWGGLLAATAYAVLAGWGVPAQRTVWMLATVVLMRSLGCHWPWPWILGAAAVVVTAIDPWAALQAGFWLSFGAVGLLMASSAVQPLPRRAPAGRPSPTAGEAAPPPRVESGFRRWRRKGAGLWPDSPGLRAVIAGVDLGSRAPSGSASVHGGGAEIPADAAAGARLLPRLVRSAAAGVQAWVQVLAELLRAQLVISIGLTPLSLLLFQQASLIGVLANLLAIPWVTMGVTPLALLGALWPPLWSLGAQAIAGLVAALERASTLVPPIWHVAVAPPWAQAAGLVAGGLAVLPLPWRLRALAVPLALPLLWPLPERPAAGQFELIAADVGQGNAVLVRTRHHQLLYDTGPSWGPAGDAGQRLLLPMLRALGVRQLDGLVLSHRDSDHVGGARAILEGLPVRRLVASLEDSHPLLAERPGLQIEACAGGRRWEWDSVHFELLHPLADVDPEPPAPSLATAAGATATKPNARSCVLRIEGAGHSALLAGDIERAQELALVEALGDGLRSDWLLVPHHGSRTSSSPAWLEAVRPQMAFVQAGHLNRFGHPAREVVERYREHGILLRTSSDCGALRWPHDALAAGPAAHRTEAAPGLSESALAPTQCERDRHRRYWHHRSAPAAPAGGP